MTAANAAGNPEQGINAEKLLPLDSPELVVWITNDEMVLCHVFRRITQADWNAYFTGGADSIAAENEIADLNANALAIYRRAILRVEGYQSNSGRKPEELPSWPECIPLEDRVAAVNSLLSVFWAFCADSFAVDKSGRRISFEIVSSDGKPGPVCRYFSAVHHFRAPTAEERERFLRASTRHAERGESAFAVLISLYDELIERVEGYSVSGRELLGKEEITREMDANHKVVAVGLLVDPCGFRAIKRTKVAASFSALGPATLAQGKLVN